MARDGSTTLSLASFSSRGRRGYARIDDIDDPDDWSSREDAKRANRDGADLDRVTFDADNWNPETNLEHPDDVPDLDYGPTFDESMETSTEDRELHLLEGYDDIAESLDPRGYRDAITEGYLTDDDSNDATSEGSSTTSVIDALAVEGPSMMCLDEDSLQQLARLGDQTGQTLAELNKYLRTELEVDGLVEEMKGFSEEAVTNGLNNIEMMKDFSEEVVTNGLDNVDKFDIPQLFTCLSLSGWVEDQTPRLVSFVSEVSSYEESVRSNPNKKESHLPSCSNDASCEEPPEPSAATSTLGQLARQPPSASFFVDSFDQDSAQSAPPQEETSLPSFSTRLKGSSCDDPVQSDPPKEKSCLPLCFSSIEDEEEGMEVPNIEESAQPAFFNELSRQPSFSYFFIDPSWEDSVQLAPPQEEGGLPSFSTSLKGSTCDDSVHSVPPKEESCLPMCFSSIDDVEEGMEIPYVSCTGAHNSNNTGSLSEDEPTTTASTRTAEMNEKQTLLSKLLFGGQRKDNAKVAPAPVALPAPSLMTGAYVSRGRPEVLRIQLRDGSMASISRDTVTRLAMCQWV